MIYVLIILSCLSDGKDCKKDVIDVDGYGMYSCLIQAQPLAAQWHKLNPRRKINQLRCVDHRRVPFEIGRDTA